MKKDFDLTVIGGGAGGLNVASGAVQLGARVALIEKNKLGGDCLYYGCVPTKALIHSAKIASLMKRSKEFGLNDTNISFDFKNIMNHMREVISKVGEHDDPKRFEKMGQILPREDKEIADALELILKEEGIDIYTCVEVDQVKQNEGLKGIEVAAACSGQKKTFQADEFMIAIGRAPNLEGLNLEAAGVKIEKKSIVVNNAMRTTARNIWACGDVTGQYLFTHVAEYQAGLVVANALIPFIKRKANYRVVPWVTYTDPELGRVGLTEDEARQRYKHVKVYRYDMKDLD